MTRNDDGEGKLTILEARRPTILYLKILNGIYIVRGWTFEYVFVAPENRCHCRERPSKIPLANSHGALNDTAIMMAILLYGCWNRVLGFLAKSN